MSTLVDIMSKLEECGGSQANTGKLGCLQQFGTPLSVILTKRGFVIPKETVLNIEFLESNVQNGNLIPVIEASAFEDVSGEDAYTTNAAGVERLNLKGLPKYKLWFEEGHEFYRQMSKLTSYKSKGAILIDDDGRWLFGVNSDGDYIGLTLGQITAEMRKTKVQGGDSEMKALSMQFIDRYQWDESYGIIERNALGFGQDEIPVINGVNLSLGEIPASNDLEVKVKAVLASDGSSPIEGLIATDFVVTSNGGSQVPSGIVEATPGEYVLTVSSLSAGVLLVDLYDSSENLDVIISGGVLYRSDVISETIV
tara:strand:- start:11525 stop:12454 length:930 start_codon:yes stop_codon:yes gene_type:complete